MRFFPLGLAAATVVLSLGFSSAARADDFMKECMVTASEKMCACMSARLPADKRGDAVQGLRKSNASVSVSGNLLDPGTLSQSQMQGLNAVVLAQAYCM